MPFDFGAESETVELLLSAKERINDGWVKGRLFTEDGRVCAIGSLREDGLRRHREDAIAALYACLPWRWRWLPARGGWSNLTAAESRIATFNDHPRTRKSDVLALYDRAIAKVRKENANAV